MPRIFSAISITAFLSFSYCPAEGFERFMSVDCFDRYFHEYTERYFGSQVDWRYFKAQAVAESRLHPQARSEDGALGLMQILPSTFRDIVEENPHIRGDIKDPRWNIAAGIYYDRLLWEAWIANRSFEDKLNFMFASYNAGKHSILKAQKVAMKKGLNPYIWPSIAETLPDVNGDRSQETIVYVDRIHKIGSVFGANTSSSQTAASGPDSGENESGITRTERHDRLSCSEISRPYSMSVLRDQPLNTEKRFSAGHQVQKPTLFPLVTCLRSRDRVSPFPERRNW